MDLNGSERIEPDRRRALTESDRWKADFITHHGTKPHQIRSDWTRLPELNKTLMEKPLDKPQRADLTVSEGEKQLRSSQETRTQKQEVALPALPYRHQRLSKTTRALLTRPSKSACLSAAWHQHPFLSGLIVLIFSCLCIFFFFNLSRLYQGYSGTIKYQITTMQNTYKII